MNKTFKKLMIMTLACLTLCGTTFAGPRGGRGRMRGPRPAPRHHVERHRRPAPRPAPRHHGHRHHCHGNDWVTLGAAAIGGVIGGILGACR